MYSECAMSKTVGDTRLFYCLGNYVGTSTASSGQGGNVSYNRADPKTSKGECGNDRPQPLVINYLYTLPSLLGGQGILGHALSRWSLARLTASVALPGTAILRCSLCSVRASSTGICRSRRK